MVGMSKSGSRYGRRSNWFKIHCLLQEQGHKGLANDLGGDMPFNPDMAFRDMQDSKEDMLFNPRASSAESLPQVSPDSKSEMNFYQGLKNPFAPSFLFPNYYNPIPPIQPVRSVMPWPLLPGLLPHSIPSSLPSLPSLPLLQTQAKMDVPALRPVRPTSPPNCWRGAKAPSANLLMHPRKDLKVRSVESLSSQEEPIDLSVKSGIPIREIKKEEIDEEDEESIFDDDLLELSNEEDIDSEMEDATKPRRPFEISPLDLTAPGKL